MTETGTERRTGTEKRTGIRKETEIRKETGDAAIENEIGIRTGKETEIAGETEIETGTGNTNGIETAVTAARRGRREFQITV